jgi:hypothetical protein
LQPLLLHSLPCAMQRVNLLNFISDKAMFVSVLQLQNVYLDFATLFRSVLA